MQVVAARAEQAIREKVFPGCVIGVLRKGKREVTAFGRHTYTPDSPVVTIDLLYDCASLTKIIPTATLALQLIDEKKLALESKLIEFIPQYRTKYCDEVTILHLLTYTLGNTTPLSQAGTTPEEIFEVVCTEETKPPGTVFSYSNTPAFLLGIVIECIMRMSLDLAADERIFKPLGMTATTFNVGLRKSHIAPTEEDVQGMVHDESARVFSRAHGPVGHARTPMAALPPLVCGHAGLFSTAPDLSKFLENLIAHPDERLCTNQIAHLNASTALGFELNQPFMGTKRSPRTFGKTGFTGTSIVCDFDRQTAIVILSNRTYPKRPKDASAINKFRSDICDIVFLS